MIVETVAAAWATDSVPFSAGFRMCLWGRWDRGKRGCSMCLCPARAQHRCSHQTPSGPHNCPWSPAARPSRICTWHTQPWIAKKPTPAWTIHDRAWMDASAFCCCFCGNTLQTSESKTQSIASKRQMPLYLTGTKWRKGSGVWHEHLLPPRVSCLTCLKSMSLASTSQLWMRVSHSTSVRFGRQLRNVLPRTWKVHACMLYWQTNLRWIYSAWMLLRLLCAIGHPSLHQGRSSTEELIIFA